jgi:hypothetical protein
VGGIQLLVCGMCALTITLCVCVCFQMAMFLSGLFYLVEGIWEESYYCYADL